MSQLVQTPLDALLQLPKSFLSLDPRHQGGDCFALTIPCSLQEQKGDYCDQCAEEGTAQEGEGEGGVHGLVRGARELVVSQGGPTVHFVWSFRTVPPIRVLAAVIERDGKLLLCQRPAHKRHGGLWEFPGGKIENDETELEAARRELLEELGVNVQTVGPTQASFQDPGSDYVIQFVPAVVEGEPRLIEHADLRWVTPHEAQSFALAPTDRAYISHIHKRASAS